MSATTVAIVAMVVALALAGIREEWRARKRRHDALRQFVERERELRNERRLG